MRLPWFIARHYFTQRRGKSVVGLISLISLIGIVVSTAALIVVLSVYNGIGNLTQQLFNVFDPMLKIEAAEGKSFSLDSVNVAKLTSIKGVKRVSEIVEEHAWVTHKQNSAIATLRGVDSLYGSVTGLDTLVQEGNYAIDNPQMVVMGGELCYNLGLHSLSSTPIALNIPPRTRQVSMVNGFNTAYAYVSGCFYLQQDIDSRYIVADINVVRKLLEYQPNEVSFLAVELAEGVSVRSVQREIEAVLGQAFWVRNRMQQQPLYYKVYRSERLGVYLILSLIVLISSLSLMASLALLIMDKRMDIKLLQSMGMQNREVRRIFRAEGVMISVCGIVLGLILGALVCGVQQMFGIVKMGSNFVVDAFPVSMRLADFIAVALLVLSLTVLSIFVTTRNVPRNSQ